MLTRFTADGLDHLVLDDPAGVPLWDAWDDPNQGAAERFAWLARLADLLHLLHRSGACLETFRPEDVRITPAGQPVLSDTGTLLPLPPTSRAALRPGPTTPAEAVSRWSIKAWSSAYPVAAVPPELALRLRVLAP